MAKQVLKMFDYVNNGMCINKLIKLSYYSPNCHSN